MLSGNVIQILSFAETKNQKLVIRPETGQCPDAQVSSLKFFTLPVSASTKMTFSGLQFKRNMSVPSSVIAGIFAGILAFNLIILTSWCLVKRRRAKAKERLIQAAYVNSNPLISRLNEKPARLWETPSMDGGIDISLHTLREDGSLSNDKGPIILSTELAQEHQLPQPVFLADSKCNSPASSAWRISPLIRASPLATSFIYPSSSSSPNENSFRPSVYDIRPQFRAAFNEDHHPSSTIADPSQSQTSRMRSQSPLSNIKEAIAPETFTRSRRRAESNPNTPYRSHYRPTSESILIPPVPPLPRRFRSLVVARPQNAALSDSLPTSNGRARETFINHSVSLPSSPIRSSVAVPPRRRGYSTTSPPSSPMNLRHK